jgi:two-component system sensor histidine kinase KdpD
MLLTALVISMLTHRVRTQSLAAQRAWERAEAEMLRNTLLLSVSHDLRTPIACITGAATSLLEAGDKLPPAARGQMLDIIYTESGRMERLINNLLDMTRLESGGMTLKRDWHHLQEITGSALRHLSTRLQSRPVQTRFPPDLPLVFVDGIALEQVLVNLLDNAVEYTPPDAPIEIEARATAAQVLLEIADRGPGLPHEGTERVFEKFYRASSVSGEKREGFGLGLAICRAIVEAHGGGISAGNRDGGGAVFRIAFPRTQAPPQVDGTA